MDIWDEKVTASKLRPDEQYYKEMPRTKIGAYGIHALFNNSEIWYVGLTDKSLRGRTRAHTRDRHKRK